MVFELSPSGDSWIETVIYTFSGNEGGRLSRLTFDNAGNPVGGVILDKSGDLYGVTSFGGMKACDSLTCGVAYEITP